MLSEQNEIFKIKLQVLKVLIRLHNKKTCVEKGYICVMNIQIFLGKYGVHVSYHINYP